MAESRYRGRANHVGALEDYANTCEIASALTFSRHERDLLSTGSSPALEP